MKANFLAKGKWYIFGIIAVVIILSIGLSFCAWDSASINSITNASIANYGNEYAMDIDLNNNQKGDVGDTIYFGNYYQSKNQIDKSPIKWRVVDVRKENNVDVMYLLTEEAVACGAFSHPSYYVKKDGEIVDPKRTFSQCYNESTVRAWLNSDMFGEARKDGGIGFTDPPEDSGKVFNGFYNEAFNEIEKSRIIARNIPGMYGYSYYKDNNTSKFRYADLPGQKVWIPSNTEITGSELGNADSLLDRQFEYFKDGDLKKRIALSTTFNRVNDGKIMSSFAFPNMPANCINTGDYAYNGTVRWLTRTPSNLSKEGSSVISNTGALGLTMGTFVVTVSTRPAICLKR